jgi:uncharacterized repeat protein (TIGR01451 family)
MAEVSKNGDLFYWKIEITNLGADDNTHVEFTPTVPSGMQYVSSSGDQGAWNPTNLRYDVGTVLTGASNAVNIILVYKVTNFAAAPFAFSGIISGDNADGVAGNNTITVTVTATTCPPSAGAVSDPLSCLCGFVGDNDTICTSGTTEWRIDETSLVNLDADFVLNVDTGYYNAHGMILNPYLPSTFQYSIWCIDGEDEYETSGPALVTIPALFNADIILTRLEKKFVIPSSVFTAAYSNVEIVKDAAVITWAANTSNIPLADRNGSVIVYDRPSHAGNGTTYEYAWWTIDNGNGTMSLIRIKEPILNYYIELPINIGALTLGSTGNTFNLDTAFTISCPGTTSYVVQANPLVFLNQTVVGSTWTYDVAANAPEGEYDIEIIPTCIIP